MNKQAVSTMALVAVLAACSAPSLEVRQISSPLKSGNLPGHERIAEGNGQMQLGNIGLAIESYRKALRYEPRNPAAHAALANAYDHMGRFDLSGRYYQQALALAPERPELYEALARSLVRQGKPVAAARVKAEALARADALRVQDAAAAHMEAAADTAQSPSPKSSVTVALAPPAPKAAPAPVPEELSLTRVSPSAAEASAAPAAPERLAAAPIQAQAPLIVGEAPVSAIAARPQRFAASTPQIDTEQIAAPPSVPLASAPSAAPRIAALGGAPEPQAPQPAIALPRPSAMPVAIARETYDGPRIERLSSGEVALVTAEEPLWKQAETAPAPRAAPRWTAKVTRPRPNSVNVQYSRAASEPAPILLVNATGTGAAGANAQAYLITKGYRSAELDIGPQMRDRSILLYPKGRREDAEALVAKLGLEIAYQVGPVERMTLHLGRDAMLVSGQKG